MNLSVPDAPCRMSDDFFILPGRRKYVKKICYCQGEHDTRYAHPMSKELCQWNKYQTGSYNANQLQAKFAETIDEIHVQTRKVAHNGVYCSTDRQ